MLTVSYERSHVSHALEVRVCEGRELSRGDLIVQGTKEEGQDDSVNWNNKQVTPLAFLNQTGLKEATPMTNCFGFLYFESNGNLLLQTGHVGQSSV